MFTLQIQCPTLDEAERIIAALKHSANPAVVDALAAQIPASATAAEVPETRSTVSGVAVPSQEPKKRGRPRREVAKKPAASVATATDDLSPNQPDKAQKTELTQQAPTLDDARAALKGVQAKYGTDDMSQPLEVLAKFSAGRISEVKPADYPRFIAACKDA